MFVKIVAGVFGHRNGKRVVPIRAGEIVEVEDAVGDRLLSTEVAVYVEPAFDDTADGEMSTADAIEKARNEIDDEVDGEVADFPEYSAEMTRAELDAIALQVGIDADEISKASNKAAVIALLDEAKEEFEAGGEAPALDAAAAIQ